MVNYWYIRGDFTRERSRRIGASDIPALIPDPERPTESLAGYGRTPITVWQEKTGRRMRGPAGLPAEMGHYLEDKAVELFIREVAGEEIAAQHLHDRRAYGFVARTNPTASAGDYQHTPFAHHAQYYTDEVIVHPDSVYSPPGREVDPKYVDVFGVRVRLDEDFLMEAKSASHWSAQRPEGSVVRGYDLALKTWQGIPLKHYMQIQFQLAILGVGVAYLPLLHDTSSYHVWQILANERHQAKLIDIAGRMAWHIRTDKPPADMAINAADIMALYPKLGEDFVVLNGEERDRAVEIAQKYRDAEIQEKLWRDRKKDAADAMAVILKDRPELRSGEGPIAKWTVKGGYEKVASLSKIRGGDQNAYRYLKRKGLIESTSDSRYVTINWRGEE